MPIKERDIVLQGRDGGEDTIDLPITRLGNVESGAEVKAEPAQGDYIPLIDSADNEQMKKFPAQWLLNYKPGAWGTGSVCTLDLEKSRIGGSLFTAYEGEDPLSEEEGDIELKIQVSDRFFRKEETGELTLTGVGLWAGAEASGVPRAFLQIQGQEGIWAGKTWNEEEARWEETPITLNYDTSGKRGLLRFQVTAEDGESSTGYVVLVEMISGDSSIESVTYTSARFPGELQYEADGVTPLTLGLEEARARYEAMGELLAARDPGMSLTNPAAMTAQEEKYYEDENGDPIRRLVYKGWLPSGTNNGIKSVSLPVYVSAEKSSSTAMIYGKDAPKPIQRKAFVDTRFYGGNRATSITRPLMALRDTGDWDKVCTRVYFQVKAEDGTMTYCVLELYNTRIGRCALGRVELGEDGLPVRDAAAKPVAAKTYYAYRGEGHGKGEIPMELEDWNVAKLKELGSVVDREKDRFAVWAYDKDLPFQEGLLPNVLVQADSWAETPGKNGEADRPEIIDADHAAPIRLTAWVSPESEKEVIYARAEDPKARMDACRANQGDRLSFINYKQGTMIASTEVTYLYDEEDPTIQKGKVTKNYGLLVELDPEVAAGEVCATAAIHVKSQDESGAKQDHTNSGRLYWIDLKKGYAARTLTGAEALGEDLTVERAGTVDAEAMTAAVSTTAEGWSWIKLTAPPAEEGDEAPLIHVLRPNVYGQFVREEKCRMPVYGAGADGTGPDLTKPLEGAAGECWVKLFCPGTYRVMVTSQNGLWDKWGKEYTLTLTKAAATTAEAGA